MRVPHRSPPPPTSPSSTALARLAPLRREQRGGGRSAARGLPISTAAVAHAGCAVQLLPWLAYPLRPPLPPPLRVREGEVPHPRRPRRRRCIVKRSIERRNGRPLRPRPTKASMRPTPPSPHILLFAGHVHAYPIRGSPSELFTRLPSSSAHSPRARCRALHRRASKTNALTSTAFCMLVEISHGVQTGHGEAP